MTWDKQLTDRFTRKTDYHSNSSQKVTGTYEPGMTKAEIEPSIRGSFGGRWVHFDNGTYTYIAYTD